MDGAQKSGIECAELTVLVHVCKTCWVAPIERFHVRRAQLGLLSPECPSRRMECQSGKPKLGIVLRCAALVTSPRLAPFGRERMHSRLQNVVVVLAEEAELQAGEDHEVPCEEI